MKLTKYTADKLLSLFFDAKSLEYAINRLKDLCLKYSINLYFLSWDFNDFTAEEVDKIYLLILTM
jgi:hypothetical protein